MLKVKKRNTQKEWVDAWNSIAQREPDKQKAEKLIEKALTRIPKETDKCIFGWSGGKDALALEIICQRAGIEHCVLGTIGEQWEYPSFWKYVQEHKPKGLEIKNFNISEQFMYDHPNLVFPANARDNYAWYQKCNQRSYYEFADEKNANYILLGHRNLDGNNCKSSKNGKIYPLFDFTHEDIFCILSAYHIQLPEMYFYIDGFKQGTHAWIMRSGATAIDDIWAIDKELLLSHRRLPKIKDFLLTKGITL